MHVSYLITFREMSTGTLDIVYTDEIGFESLRARKAGVGDWRSDEICS